LCLLLAVCILGVTSLEWQQTPSSTTPMLMWTDTKIFQASQIVDTLTSNNVEDVLASLLNTKSQNSIFNDVVPEVVVLFVEPELTTFEFTTRSARGSFSNLKSAVEGASSTLTIPYITADSTLLDGALPKVFDNTQGSVFITRLSGSTLFTQYNNRYDVKVVEIDSLLSELKAANAFSNGITDVVVVGFDKPAYPSESSAIFHDEYVGSIFESIRTASKGSYVAIYTANTPSFTNIVWAFDQYEQDHSFGLRAVIIDDPQYLSDLAINNTNSTTHKVNYFPGPLLEVYIISAMLIAMLFTGGCAIFSLQTPDRWEAPKVKKELF